MEPKARILLVEDEAIIALNIADILASKGYAVVGTFMSGEEALDFVKNERPDCILMDIMLRGIMDGIQTAEALRAIADVPVIYLTAHTDDSTIERAKATGPFGYVVKPVNPYDLVTAIEIAIYKYEADKKLRVSEERYRSFVENFQGIAFQSDINFNPLFLHGSVEEITGYTEKEFLAGSPRWDQIIHPDDIRGIYDDAMRMRSEADFKKRREYRIVRRDGAIRWVNEIFQYLAGSDSRPEFVRGVILDITEKKETDELIERKNIDLETVNEELNATIEELEASNEAFETQNRELLVARNDFAKSDAFLRSIFRAAPVGIGIVEGRTLGWTNEAFCEITGFSEDELSGKSVRILYQSDEEFENVGRDQYARVSQDGTGILETQWKRKDGTIIDVLLSSTPIDPSDLSKGITFAALDITERKAMERELRRLTAILESTSDLVATSTPDRWVTYLNRAGRELIGYGPEADIGSLRISDFHPDWAYDFISREGIPRAIGEGVWEGETAVLTSAGREVPVSQVIISHKSEKGEVQYLSTVMRDISERKKAEQLVRESEEKLRNIIEHSTNAFYSHTADHVLTYMSPQFKDIFGYQPEEAKTRWPELTTDNPINIRGYEATERAIATGMRQEPYELELRHRDGHAIFVEVHEAPVVVNGTTVAVVGALTDITKRKSAEAALKRSEERFRMLVETMRDGMAVLDARGRLNYVNPRLCEMLGRSREDLLGTDPMDLLDEKNREVLVYQLGKRMESGTEVYELEWTRPDGRKTLALVSPKVIFDEKGDFAGSFGVITDITERRRAEELMLQNEKMMTIGGLAAGMAHEINNPLGIILQGVQATNLKLSREFEANRKLAEETGIALDRLREYLEKSEIFSYLDGISEAGQRAAEIVTSMLQFSRRSTGKKTSVNLSELLDRTIEMASRDYDLKKKYDFRKIAIVREYDISLTAVPCVSTEMEQVMINLLKNAAQALSGMEGEGFTPRIMVTTKRTDDSAVITISDNGPGIDDYTRRHLFEPFYTTKGPGDGTGLGLAVSFFIVTRNHNGSISAEQGEGGGTAFVVKLPLTGGKR